MGRKSTKVVVKKTKAEMRVEIAKDVIKQIGTGRFWAKKGTYFLPSRGYFSDMVDKSGALPDRANTVDVQEVLKASPRATCDVCAKGAIFAACVIRHNRFRARRWAYDLDWDDFADYLSKYFPVRQLNLIEVAFEGEAVRPREVTDKDTVAGVAFYKQAGRSAKGRMIRIMKNLIANNGTFKPKAVPA